MYASDFMEPLWCDYVSMYVGHSFLVILWLVSFLMPQTASTFLSIDELVYASLWSSAISIKKYQIGKAGIGFHQDCLGPLKGHWRNVGNR